MKGGNGGSNIEMGKLGANATNSHKNGKHQRLDDEEAQSVNHSKRELNAANSNNNSNGSGNGSQGDQNSNNQSASLKNSSQKQQQLPQNNSKINRDEIIEKLSQDMKKFNEEHKQGNNLQRIVMMLVFFSIQAFTLTVLSINDKTDLLNFGLHSSKLFWLEVACTLMMYLYVAFKNPGYVTSSFMRDGDDYDEQDFDGVRNSENNKRKLDNDLKHRNKKVKQSILSQAASKLSRKERLTNANSGNNMNLNLSQLNSGSVTPSGSRNYHQVNDNSQRVTPNNKLNASHNRFVFSNLTTQNCDNGNYYGVNGINDTVNLDDSTLNYSSLTNNNNSSNTQKGQKDKKNVKIIAQISKNTSRTSTLQELNQSEIGGGNYSFMDEKIQNDNNNSKINPLEIIQKKLAQNTQRNGNLQIQTTEGDLSGKPTTASTQQSKQQLIDKGATRSDFFEQQQNLVGFIVGEKEIQARRNKLLAKNNSNNHLDEENCNNHYSIEELDIPGGNSNNNGSVDYKVNQFDAIVEENEEDFQKEEIDFNRTKKLNDKSTEISSPIQRSDANSEPQSMFHVEPKMCTKCNIEQPLRTKHCRNCNRCVATYDHHCPWIGNCVAEKNRRFFFYFLVLQFIESIWGFVYSLMSFHGTNRLDRWITLNLLNLMACIICFFFILMVGSLVFFHLFLSSSNLTTWEFLSWNKISYMKVWPKRYGSPFSQGQSRWTNLRMYFCQKKQKKSQYFAQWKMPLGLPELSENEIKKRRGYRTRCCILKY
eukprot:403377170